MTIPDVVARPLSRPRVRLVQRSRPVGPRSRRDPLALGDRPPATRHPPGGPPAARPGSHSAPRPPRPHHRRDLGRARRLARLRVPAPAVPRRDLPPPAEGVRSSRLELREARPDHLGRRGPVPRRDGHRVQAAPRPGAARDVRGRPGRRRSRPRRHARGAVLRPSTRSRSRPRRSPRCTRPGSSPAKRSSSRCSARGWRSSSATTSPRSRGSRPA